MKPLSSVEPGPITETSRLEPLLVAHSDDLDGGGEGGMLVAELLDRMEDIQSRGSPFPNRGGRSNLGESSGATGSSTPPCRMGFFRTIPVWIFRVPSCRLMAPEAPWGRSIHHGVTFRSRRFTITSTT